MLLATMAGVAAVPGLAGGRTDDILENTGVVTVRDSARPQALRVPLPPAAVATPLLPMSGLPLDAPPLAQGDWQAAAWALGLSDTTTSVLLGSRSHVPEQPQARVVVQRVWGEDSLAALICAPEFTWDCGAALRVFTCESGLNPMAYNPRG